MSDGHHLIIAGNLDPILRAFKYSDFLIAIQHWLIQELNSELKYRLAGAVIEVIKVEYIGAYPGLGIYFGDLPDNPDLEPLVEVTIDRILKEKSMLDFITFLAAQKANGTDWNALTTKIMSQGE
ncbi:MAG: hypothetical protein ABI970_19170 [Chloroflexota bacterium]